MFDYMRQHSKKFMAVLLVLIVPSFVFLGVDGYQRSQGGSQVVAEIGGLEIKANQLDAVNSEKAIRLREQLPADVINSEQFRYQTLQDIVREESVRSLAQKYRYIIGNKQLINIIETDPELALFVTDGRLDIEKMRNIATNNGMSLANYENYLRYSFGLNSFQNGAVKSAIYSNKQLDNAIDLFNELYSIERSLFAPQDYFTKVSLDNDELEQFYQQHKDQYLTTEKADIEYVLLDEAEIAKHLTVDEAQLKQIYQQSLANQDTKRRFSQILIKADSADATELAQQLLQQAKTAPAEFATLAQQHSEELLSVKDGGDFGWVAAEELPSALEPVVFSLAKDQVADEVVISEYGYHIIKLTDIEQPKSFAAVKTELEREYKQEEARRQFAVQLASLKSLAFEMPETMEPIVEELNLTLRQLDALEKQPDANLPDEIAGNADFLAELFKSTNVEQKINTAAIELPSGKVIVARIKQHYPPRILSFAEVKGQITQQLKQQKALALAAEQAKVELAKVEQNIAAAKLKQAKEVSITNMQDLTANEVRQLILLGSQELPAVVAVDLADAGYSIIKLTAITAPTPEEFERRLLQMRVKYSYGSEEQMAYLAELQDIAKAKILLPKPKTEENLTD